MWRVPGAGPGPRGATRIHETASNMGEFEQAVLLAILHLEHPAYGMEVRSVIESRTGRDVSIGAVYTTLERLRRKGYVASQVGEGTPERGGRAKKFYQVEPAGLEALRRSWEFTQRMWGSLPAALAEGEEGKTG